MQLASLVNSLNEKYGPQEIKNAFFFLQIVVGGLFLLVFLKMRSGATSVHRDSGFAVRESDLRKAQGKVPPGAPGGKSDLANAKLRTQGPLQLDGIRIGGTPHEVLGIALGATEDQIQKAYRERMKQYHPDKVGPPGSREWHDAQKIAEAINAAKEELLKRARARG